MGAKESYIQTRGDPTDAELRLYLLEVDHHCPLCEKELQSRRPEKQCEKKSHIAQIDPSSPTEEQRKTLILMTTLHDATLALGVEAEIGKIARRVRLLNDEHYSELNDQAIPFVASENKFLSDIPPMNRYLYEVVCGFPNWQSNKDRIGDVF